MSNNVSSNIIHLVFSSTIIAIQILALVYLPNDFIITRILLAILLIVYILGLFRYLFGGFTKYIAVIRIILVFVVAILALAQWFGVI